MQVAFFWGDSTRSSAEHQAQRDAPLQIGHQRCGCRSRRHVDQLKFLSIGMRWSAVFVTVRFFRSCGRTLLSRLWFDLFREQVASGVQLVGLSNSLAEFVVAVCTQATPTSRPRLVFVAEARDCASCPFGRRLSSPCLVHDHVVERAVEDGAASVALACTWMQLLKLRKTATS